MSPEEVKIKLEGIKWLDEEIKQLQLELKYLEQGTLSKSSLTQTKVQTSRANSTENKYLYTIRLRQDIEEKLAEIISERLESSRLIDKASDPLERAFLRMAYVNRLEIWDIEKRIDKSKVTIYRIKRDGIENIAKSIN